MATHTNTAYAMYLHYRGFRFSAESLGEPFAGYKDFDACVRSNGDKADPYAYCGTIKRQAETVHLAGSIRVAETLEATLQERIAQGHFSWEPDLNKLKELSKNKGGKFLLIEAIHPMVTDAFNQGHGSRMWTETELMKTMRTGAGKGLTINHEIQLDPRYMHVVTDSEYNEKVHAGEMIVYESDPEILRLIKENYITKVSIDGQARRETTKCDSCGTTGCRCHKVPEGVMLGESNGSSLAYVVTREGATYYGRPIPAAPPGDWNSSIHVLETNSLNSAGRASGHMSTDSSTQPITREALIKMAESMGRKRIAEMVKEPEKYLVKEDLQAFQDKMNSGDALGALMVLASDQYHGNGQTSSGQQQPVPPAQRPPGDKDSQTKETHDPNTGPDNADGREKPTATNVKPPTEDANRVKDNDNMKVDAKIMDTITKEVASKVAEIQSVIVAEVSKLMEQRVAELVKTAPEISSIKESMQRLSTQVTETFKEAKAAATSKTGLRIRETIDVPDNQPTIPINDPEKAREIINKHIQYGR